VLSAALFFAFWEVVFLGRSFVKGIKSGAPGKYFLSGSGTLKPCSIIRTGSAKRPLPYSPLRFGNFLIDNKARALSHKVLSLMHGHTSS
jgi:hypothetical protein